MEEHWYGNPEVMGSSPGPVKFSLPIFQILHFFIPPKCGADISILAGPLSKAGRIYSAFDKGLAWIGTSGPHFLDIYILVIFVSK